MPSPPHLLRTTTRAIQTCCSNANRTIRTTTTRAIIQPDGSDSRTKAPSTAAPLPICRVFDLRSGCIPYQEGWDLQHALADELKKDAEASDALILLEHQPVYTLGTASRLENVLFNAREVRRHDMEAEREGGGYHSNRNSNIDGTLGDAVIVRTERGGEVTYHGPGQLVAYPILNLRRHKMDLHWYLRALEDTVIHMLHHTYNVRAGRKPGLTGVWVGDDKVCAMGLKVSKWITMHGLAVNVHTDLQPFSRIVPCGIDDHGVSSLHHILSQDVCLYRARESLIESFDTVFGPYEFTHVDTTASAAQSDIT